MARAVGRRGDRRIAWFAFGIAVVVNVAVVASSEAPAPPLARNDPAAAVDLVALLRRGERVDAIVEYAVTRTVRDQPGKLETTVIEARWGKIRLTRGGDTLLISTSQAAYDCQLVDGRPNCAPRVVVRSLEASDVFAYAIALGTYDITRRPDETIAEEPAQCFQAVPRARGHEVPGIDAETDICLARDGVVLRVRHVARDATEQRLAPRVVRTVNLDTLRPVYTGFDAAFASARR